MTQGPDLYSDDEAANAEFADGLYGDRDGGAEDEPRTRHRLRRGLILVVSAGLVVALLALGGLWYLTDRYAGNIARIPDVFGSLNEADRPPVPTQQPGGSGIPTTFLLVGSDVRAPGQTTGEAATAQAGNQRSDVIMVVQLAADRKSAFAISIPRDSFVPVPGYGTTKINAAYAYGGASLLVQTVENLTKVRIDHFMAVDFEGFKAITDALGGVDVRIAAATSAHGSDFQAGLNHLDGEAALAYVRQRYQLPGGDFDRVQRHQNYLRAVMAKVSQEHLVTNPARLDNFLVALTDSVSVDDQLSNVDLLSMAVGLRSLKPSDVAFMTVPVTGTGTEGTASVVYLDKAKGEAMWNYVRQGTLDDHLSEFDQLPATPR